MARQKLVAGNWKMNGLAAAKAEVEALLGALKARAPRTAVSICPPATLLALFAPLVRGSPVALGGQDCHPEASGAFTGDISAAMLKDAGASYVIVGHSERRQLHGEPSALVARKAAAAQKAGLTAILCVGETWAERDAGSEARIVTEQLDASIPDGADPRALVIAYEPVWAIGTGRVAQPADIAAMHRLVRERLRARFGGAGEAVGVLYGGSVKPDNAKEILAVPDVDGALVGGASLKAKDFLAIIAAA
jgi:triosephosphate isomerase